MCGIAGLAGRFHDGLALAMNRAQAHRGPDGQGVYEDPAAGIALAHVRLAILDLSPASSQPMKSDDGRWVLVYNGEIYNYRELGAELRKEGEVLRTTGDSEVLLKGLARHGAKFLSRLNGIFSFALWDSTERRLLLVRDPLGVKPLYWTQPAAGSLAFASEIKALLQVPGLARRPHFPTLFEHLNFGYALSASTALDGVRRLEPGHLIEWSQADPTPRISRYWSPTYSSTPDASRDESVARLRENLQLAVARQMVSDVPVGTFLSGGLDSSLISILASRGSGSGLACYTSRYPQNSLDGLNEDPKYAELVAKALGSQPRWIDMSPDVALELPRAIWHMDEPVVDPSILAGRLISRQARADGIPVLLTGQGGDELFAGYSRYRAMVMTGWAAWLPGPLRSVLAAVGRGFPGSKSGRLGGFSRRTRRVLSNIEKSPDARFLSYAAPSAESTVRTLLMPGFQAAVRERSAAQEGLLHMEREGLRGIDRWLDYDLSVYLANNNLLYTDKMGMAYGIEARVPLLDLRIVEETTRFPVDWKLDGSKTKAILRDACRGVVPDAVIDRPKAGFGAPHRRWLKEDLADLWEDLTRDSVLESRGWFDPGAVREIRKRSLEGREDLYLLQWGVMTLELWAREFLDGRGSTA